MDLLESYFHQYKLTESRILEECDEWCLYLYYLENNELALNTTYRSPIRDSDENPSFSIYENTRSKKFNTAYLWKDSALNKVGDIFSLLESMFNLSRDEVLQKINFDFDILEESKDVSIQKRVIVQPTSKNSRIKVKTKPFSKQGIEFWKSFHITEELLNWKQVKEVEFVWFNEEQEYPYFCKDLTFCYPEYNKKYKTWHYQIYVPLSQDKQYKFRNDLTHNMLYGNNHLEFKTKDLIITKSNKDILVLKLLGYEAISPRSETTPIKSKHLEWYKERYERLILLYDNDIPGKQAASQYDIPSIIVPEDSDCKDISDYIKKFGVNKTKELLEYLMNFI